MPVNSEPTRAPADDFGRQMTDAIMRAAAATAAAIRDDPMYRLAVALGESAARRQETAARAALRLRQRENARNTRRVLAAAKAARMRGA